MNTKLINSNKLIVYDAINQASVVSTPFVRRLAQESNLSPMSFPLQEDLFRSYLFKSNFLFFIKQNVVEEIQKTRPKRFLQN